MGGMTSLAQCEKETRKKRCCRTQIASLFRWDETGGGATTLTERTVLQNDIPADVVRVLCEDIDELALALIAPLGPQNHRHTVCRQHLNQACAPDT